MSKKEILCESCEAVFRIQHNMEERYYSVGNCPFCGDTLIVITKMNYLMKTMSGNVDISRQTN